MTVLTRRHVLGGLCSCSALALAACTATNAPEGQVSPGFRPQAASDEGGLWHALDKAEADTRNSHALVRDEDLNAYVKGIVCQLAADHCADVRVYIIRTPAFNAVAAPNGMLLVWTGLLLRTQNEAQLAAVLGHELGHYLQRHALQRQRDIEAKSSASALLSAGLALPGALAGLALMATSFSFSRDQEREADAIGFDLMSKAGYRPIEASRMWDEVVAEEKADKDRHNPSFFFASHPGSEERAQTLREKAQQANPAAGDVYLERYQAHLKPIRPMLIEDELRLRQYDRTLVVLKTLNETWPADASLAYYEGEVYRLRDGEGDRKEAFAHYERALGLGNCPPELYRSVGLLHMKSGERDLAQASFRKYLELRPNPNDSEMIRSYLRQN